MPTAAVLPAGAVSTPGERGWRTALRVGAALGSGLLLASAVCELANLLPLVQMWLGVAGAAVLLVTVATVRGPLASVLRARARLLAGTGVGAMLAVIGLWQASQSPTLTVLLLLVPVALLFLTAVLAIAQARVVAQRSAIEQRRAELAAEEAERLRWVRELHDETLQDLAAVEMTLSGLDPAADPRRAADAVEDARALVRHQIRSLRALLTRMRPLALEQHGLAGALEHLATSQDGRTAVRVVAELGPLPRLDAADELAVYRIAQEAVANAVAHANAHAITVRAASNDGTVEVSVNDDGTGFRADAPPPSEPGRGYGLVTMTERAEALGTRLVIDSAPGAGTTVSVSVPAHDVA